MSQLVKVKKLLFKNISCPICAFNKSKVCYSYFYDQKESNILECQQCQHLFINPVPLVKLDSRSMDSVSDLEFFSSKILRFIYEKIVLNKEIDYVKKFCGNKLAAPTLLDIACGTGWTASIWQRSGFSVTGLESSPARSQYCRNQYNLKVFTGFIEEFNTREQFDVITMRHALEHIEYPIAILEKVKSLLKDDGILLITLPNINSIGRYIFLEHWTWVLPWHLHYYHPITLETLLEKAGFRKLKLYQMVSPIWYPEALMDFLGVESLASRLFSKLPRIVMMFLFTPIILLGIIFKLNDNMTIISKKYE